MRKIELQEVFPIEYLELITKYKNSIQELLHTYDLVIFMARKAICFYKALVENGEIIPNKECLVLSSRVLSYNIGNKFCNKKVAVVDDVVVRGTSVSESRRLSEEKGINPDVHILACEKKFIDAIDFCESIKSPFIYLSDMEIYQLSSYITEYIKLSMVPYNVDQPIYAVSFDKAEDYENNFFKVNHILNLSDGLQTKYGIENMTIHFNPFVMKNIFGYEIPMENCYLKIRFLHRSDSLKMTVIPFVLLPEISYEKLDEVFGRIFGNRFDECFPSDNIMETRSDKLRILQYVLSDELFRLFSKSFGKASIEKDMENEQMKFAFEIKDSYRIEELDDVFSGWHYADQVKGIGNHFMFDTVMSDVYDYVFNENETNEKYLDTAGDEQRQRIITFEGLTASIAETEGNCDKYALSSMIDILIDKGILVPAIVHSRSGSVLRGYKRGEIYNLTKKGIDLFVYMLSQYSDVMNDKYQKKYLDKTELEKLCVLFFKDTAYKHRFFSVNENFDYDCFSICYSKFGPRVSNSNKKYKVGKKSALAVRLEEEGGIWLYNEKYFINSPPSVPERSWKICADNFVLSYLHLYDCFSDGTLRFSYVNSYNEFITLLSIGSSKKNQMYSLVAELYLLERINMNVPLKQILDDMDHYSELKGDITRPLYQGIIDGISSGLWKYSCYTKEGLMDNLFAAARRKQDDVRFILEDYVNDSDGSDANPIYDRMIEECGALLYEIAFLFNFSRRKYPGKETLYERNYKNKLFKGMAFYNDKFKSMRHGIYKLCENASDEELRQNFVVLKKRAISMVNKCDLFLENAAINKITSHEDMWAVYDPVKTPESIGVEIKIDTNIETDSIKKCIFVEYKSDIDLGQQIQELYAQYPELEKGALLVLINASEQYEGIFSAHHTATGDYFKEIIRRVIEKANYTPEDGHMVVICRRAQLPDKDYMFDEFSLRYAGCEEVYDGYKYAQYYLVKGRKSAMTNTNSETGMGGIHANSVVFNGPVGAIGDHNQVQQNFDSNKVNYNMEEFYKAIGEMKTEVLNDKNSMKIAEDIQADARKKDEKSVLEKLKNLALTVGSTVFTKLASTVIVDVMKAKGYFPF
ncbi:MAG: hypothetical protein LUI14_01010 [Lachnospiraceae bacterium]|nr:hypothetical protein [Lachnospiraceae bacterium]